jgi:ribonucleotide reductase, class II
MIALRKSLDFPMNAPSANPVYYRTYSRFDNGTRESWGDTCARITDGIAELGELDDEEKALLYRNVRSLKCLPSGRWLWVGGTKWIKKPENFYGAYNCSSTSVLDWKAFGLMMNLAMQGCGTGAILEEQYISQLPAIVNKLNVQVIGEPGLTPKHERQEETQIKFDLPSIYVKVGDSRAGWVESYQFLLELSSDTNFPTELNITVDVSNVRPKGEKLKTFGGVANPNTLKSLYPKVANILNNAIGRKLNSLECCLIIDEAASVVVAGNLRRSAGMRQGDSNDQLFANAKDNLWQQDETGAWVIDPKRDALRMANHTRVFHQKPTQQECIDSVRKQYYSGEGAIQWAGEAVARANADLIQTQEEKEYFLSCYNHSLEFAEDFLLSLMVKKQVRFNSHELGYRMGIYGLNPCGR